MNHQPTRLALLISLIFAGASPGAFGKTDDKTQWRAAAVKPFVLPSELPFEQPFGRPLEQSPAQPIEALGEPVVAHPFSSTAAQAPRLDLALPESWPSLPKSLQDAEPGSLGSSLSTAAAHDFSEAWLPTQPAAATQVDSQFNSQHRVVDVSEPDAFAVDVAPQEPPLWSRSDAAAPIDALERANQAAHVDRLMQTLSAVQLADIPTLNAEVPPAVAARAHPDATAATLAAVVVSSTEAQIIQRLEAIRLQLQAPVEAAPTFAPATSQSDVVLATLTSVLASPPAESNSVAITTDQPSPEEVIAARHEEKRMRQKLRAEASALAALAALAATGAKAVTATSAAGGPATALTELASPAKPRLNPFGGQRLAVHESALDRVRGGFVTPNLNISFGIERAVYINGALVTTTSLNISDLGRVTTGAGTKLTDPGGLALIQSGTGNSVAGGAFSSSTGVGLSANAIGTVVQNTLDGQKIQNVTVINATANSLGVLRDLNLQNSLRNSLIDSLRR